MPFIDLKPLFLCAPYFYLNLSIKIRLIANKIQIDFYKHFQQNHKQQKVKEVGISVPFKSKIKFES